MCGSDYYEAINLNLWKDDISSGDYESEGGYNEQIRGELPRILNPVLFIISTPSFDISLVLTSAPQYLSGI